MLGIARNGPLDIIQANARTAAAAVVMGQRHDAVHVGIISQGVAAKMIRDHPGDGGGTVH